jgi:hypothetical protein
MWQIIVRIVKQEMHQIPVRFIDFLLVLDALAVENASSHHFINNLTTNIAKAVTSLASSGAANTSLRNEKGSSL